MKREMCQKRTLPSGIMLGDFEKNFFVSLLLLLLLLPLQQQQQQQ